MGEGRGSQFLNNITNDVNDIVKGQVQGTYLIILMSAFTALGNLEYNASTGTSSAK